jgi:hypothetical protein
MSMHRRVRLLSAAALALVCAAAALAGNITVARPSPPPKGTTIALTSAASSVSARSAKVPLYASLRSGDKPVEVRANVEFRIVSGDATLAQATVMANDKGVATASLSVGGPGTVVVEATCHVKGCRGALTLEVAEEQ